LPPPSNDDVAAARAEGPHPEAGTRLERELGAIALDGLRPAALAVGVLFLFFTVYNAMTLDAPARDWLVLCDLALVALGFGLRRACDRYAFTTERVHVAAAALSFAVLGNILLAANLGVSPFFTLYTVVLMISSAGSVIQTRWAAIIAAGELLGWALTARRILPAYEFREGTLILTSGLAAAFIVHVGRLRARTRIVQLRRGDAERETTLHKALAEADDARRGLDRKVEERTAALREELEERKRLEAQLRHAQKMEAVGRLAGGVAHDFNNLLTVIRMSMETFGETEQEGDVADALRDARDAADRAADLTQDLLAFARKQTLVRKDVAVGDILRGVERMVRRVMPASIHLSVTSVGDVGEVLADKNQIEQVLLNLAINACDAMGDRGTLSVSTDAVEHAGTVQSDLPLPAGPYVRIAVKDTGTGMDETTRSSIFEPFFTTKEVGRGTGLGLAVAHGIVAQHGGHIAVESELGKGSTFVVWLPRARASMSPIRADAPPSPKTAQHEMVLLVEDEPAVRRAVQRTLERLGYRVLPATDGEDALKIAESLRGIDLLVSDVVMPGIDGPELASRLRTRWPDLRVLFLTGYSSDRLARSDALGPRDRVLQKPYQVGELAQTLRDMLAAPARASAAPSAPSSPGSAPATW
jgi:signal transduction histidine kinase/ActR/RegA family two-component response regulator